MMYKITEWCPIHDMVCYIAEFNSLAEASGSIEYFGHAEPMEDDDGNLAECVAEGHSTSTVNEEPSSAGKGPGI